jgi:large subunit ribosomal protein L16
MAKKQSKKGAQFSTPKAAFKRFHKLLCKGAPRYAFKATSNGNFALKSIEDGRIPLAQLEACKKYIKKTIKKKGRLLTRAYTYLPLTKKPGETRMGKGKSSRVSDWVCPVYSGKILFEIVGLSEHAAVPLLTKVQQKISLKTKVSSLIR